MRLVKRLYMRFNLCVSSIFIAGSCILYYPSYGGPETKEGNDKRLTMFVWLLTSYGMLLFCLLAIEALYVAKKATKCSYQDITIEFSHLEVS